MTTPVWVPSKGRAGHSATLTSMSRDGVVANVLVPESEVSLYRKSHGNSHIIYGTAVEGIGRTRREILARARENGDAWVWLIDDDITGTFYRVDKKFKPVGWASFMDEIESQVETWPTVAVAGPTHRQYAWSGPDEVPNRNLRDIVLLRTDGPWDYWPMFLEDLDICLQVLQSGRHTLRFNAFAYTAPQMGTTPGGCADGYAAGVLEESRRALHDRWEQWMPGLLTMNLHPKGYVQTKVKWDAFSQPAREL